MKRHLKASISGLSVTAAFLAAFTVVSQLDHLCDEHHIVWERRSPLTQWVTGIAPQQAWQWWVSGLLLLVGFFRLGYQTNESTAAVLSRAFMAFSFVSVCVAMLPLVAGSALWPQQGFSWANLVLPVMCGVPLWLSMTKARNKS